MGPLLLLFLAVSTVSAQERSAVEAYTKECRKNGEGQASPEPEEKTDKPAAQEGAAGAGCQERLEGAKREATERAEAFSDPMTPAEEAELEDLAPFLDPGLLERLKKRGSGPRRGRRYDGAGESALSGAQGLPPGLRGEDLAVWSDLKNALGSSDFVFDRSARRDLGAEAPLVMASLTPGARPADLALQGGGRAGRTVPPLPAAAPKATQKPRPFEVSRDQLDKALAAAAKNGGNNFHRPGEQLGLEGLPPGAKAYVRAGRGQDGKERTSLTLSFQDDRKPGLRSYTRASDGTQTRVVRNADGTLDTITSPADGTEPTVSRQDLAKKTRTQGVLRDGKFVAAGTVLANSLHAGLYDGGRLVGAELVPDPRDRKPYLRNLPSELLTPAQAEALQKEVPEMGPSRVFEESPRLLKGKDGPELRYSSLGHRGVETHVVKIGKDGKAVHRVTVTDGLDLREFDDGQGLRWTMGPDGREGAFEGIPFKTKPDEEVRRTADGGKLLVGRYDADGFFNVTRRIWPSGRKAPNLPEGPGQEEDALERNIPRSGPPPPPTLARAVGLLAKTLGESLAPRPAVAPLLNPAGKEVAWDLDARGLGSASAKGREESARKLAETAVSKLGKGASERAEALGRWLGYQSANAEPGTELGLLVGRNGAIELSHRLPDGRVWVEQARFESDGLRVGKANRLGARKEVDLREAQRWLYDGAVREWTDHRDVEEAGLVTDVQKVTAAVRRTLRPDAHGKWVVEDFKVTGKYYDAPDKTTENTAKVGVVGKTIEERAKWFKDGMESVVGLGRNGWRLVTAGAQYVAADGVRVTGFRSREYADEIELDARASVAKVFGGDPSTSVSGMKSSFRNSLERSAVEARRKQADDAGWTEERLGRDAYDARLARAVDDRERTSVFESERGAETHAGWLGRESKDATGLEKRGLAAAAAGGHFVQQFMEAAPAMLGMAALTRLGEVSARVANSARASSAMQAATTGTVTTGQRVLAAGATVTDLGTRGGLFVLNLIDNVDDWSDTAKSLGTATAGISRGDSGLVADGIGKSAQQLHGAAQSGLNMARTLDAGLESGPRATEPGVPEGPASAPAAPAVPAVPDTASKISAAARAFQAGVLENADRAQELADGLIEQVRALQAESAAFWGARYDQTGNPGVRLQAGRAQRRAQSLSKLTPEERLAEAERLAERHAARPEATPAEGGTPDQAPPERAAVDDPSLTLDQKLALKAKGKAELADAKAALKDIAADPEKFARVVEAFGRDYAKARAFCEAKAAAFQALSEQTGDPSYLEGRDYWLRTSERYASDPETLARRARAALDPADARYSEFDERRFMSGAQAKYVVAPEGFPEDRFNYTPETYAKLVAEGRLNPEVPGARPIGGGRILINRNQFGAGVAKLAQLLAHEGSHRDGDLGEVGANDVEGTIAGLLGEPNLASPDEVLRDYTEGALTTAGDRQVVEQAQIERRRRDAERRVSVLEREARERGDHPGRDPGLGRSKLEDGAGAPRIDGGLVDPVLVAGGLDGSVYRMRTLWGGKVGVKVAHEAPVVQAAGGREINPLAVEFRLGRDAYRDVGKVLEGQTNLRLVETLDHGTIDANRLGKSRVEQVLEALGRREPQPARLVEALTMRFVEGEVLEDFINRGGKVTRSEWEGVAKGIDLMHRNGWAHTDIHPRQLIVTKDLLGRKTFHLLDFNKMVKEGDGVDGIVEAWATFGQTSRDLGLPELSDGDWYQGASDRGRTSLNVGEIGMSPSVEKAFNGAFPSDVFRRLHPEPEGGPAFHDWRHSANLFKHAHSLAEAHGWSKAEAERFSLTALLGGLDPGREPGTPPEASRTLKLLEGDFKGERSVEGAKGKSVLRDRWNWTESDYLQARALVARTGSSREAYLEAVRDAHRAAARESGDEAASAATRALIQKAAEFAALGQASPHMSAASFEVELAQLEALAAERNAGARGRALKADATAENIALKELAGDPTATAWDRDAAQEILGAALEPLDADAVLASAGPYHEANLAAHRAAFQKYIALLGKGVSPELARLQAKSLWDKIRTAEMDRRSAAR